MTAATVARLANIARVSLTGVRTVERLQSQTRTHNHYQAVPAFPISPPSSKSVTFSQQRTVFQRKEDGFHESESGGTELLRIAAFNRWLIKNYAIASPPSPVSPKKLSRVRPRPPPYSLAEGITAVPQTAGDFAAEVVISRQGISDEDVPAFATALLRHKVLVVRNASLLSASDCASLSASLGRQMDTNVCAARVSFDSNTSEFAFASYDPLKNISPEMNSLVTLVQTSRADIDLSSIEMSYIRTSALDARMAW
eukprot:CAMPEP_0184649638 /NCGR_PEP_ID=MMETSP0308-20130426/7035_1 /TAXON_ID=38269 /ORGANISM="Gloeochaete witrockiana, Strain SAG 46.84" /LENGTH=253 /DNA_ID=CAMNT_0027082515 /DNA_START=259 /DNA_END=1017 /DNA_ORIENTATION=-